MNLSWDKFGDWWIPSLYVSLCLSDHNTLRILMWRFSMFDCYIHFQHWHANDIDWFSWLSYHMDFALAMIILLILTCMFILLYISFFLVIESFVCILSWSYLSMLSLLLFILIVILPFSLCVDMDDIFVLCLMACCMTALLLCDCMLLVCVGHTSIPLPPTLWFRSFHSFWVLHLQV